MRNIADSAPSISSFYNGTYLYNTNHMAQWNMFDVVNSVILKYAADDL